MSNRIHQESAPLEALVYPTFIIYLQTLKTKSAPLGRSELNHKHCCINHYPKWL